MDVLLSLIMLTLAFNIEESFKSFNKLHDLGYFSEKMGDVGALL